MKKIIVTGATGYIGRNFIRAVTKQNVSVIAVVRDEDRAKKVLSQCEHISFVKCTMADYERLEQLITERNFHAFYHFAWAGVSGKDRANYKLQTFNAKYTCDAACAAKALGCQRFITTGTITEQVADNILTRGYQAENLLYGLAKSYTHKMLDIVARKIKLDYIWASLSNIYGGDNTTGNLISYTLKEISAKHVPTYGPCEQPYNFTHIDDVVSALIHLGRVSEHQHNSYFISNGECRKLKEYLEDIAISLHAQITIGERLDDGIRYEEKWFDNSLLEKEIGFQPQISFEQGLEKMKESSL